MIAVLADETEHPVVREFFELFKTPWDFYRSDLAHEVLICSASRIPDSSAKLVLVYGAAPEIGGRENEFETGTLYAKAVLSYKQHRMPIYEGCTTLGGAGVARLREEKSGEPVALQRFEAKRTVVRLGYDLFREIRHLLTFGQPATFAEYPTLDLHIAVLRDLIVACSILLVEIPPVPAGHPFLACLTHDVDHPAIRRHRGDYTMFGFLYRATIGSLVNFCTGRKSFRELAANWMAAFSLPLVYLGLVKDFWNSFDRYLAIEKGLTSTFFVIPRKGDPGRNITGPAPSRRASCYSAAEVADELRRLISEQREIALHGIDAWNDAKKGEKEREIIGSLTGEREVGVRMHWLYFDERSPGVLEKAGFSYDSTVGYNETVGYRAGTTQVYKPLATEHLLELPLHIMDTALFYPSYMNLPLDKAGTVIDPLIENVSRSGGVVTVNWHDRSVAPERLWGSAYAQLLQNLRSRNAWFGTGRDIVSWFRKRRAAKFQSIVDEGKEVRVNVSLGDGGNALPGLLVRLHPARSGCSDSFDQENRSNQFVDMNITQPGECVFAV